MRQPGISTGIDLPEKKHPGWTSLSARGNWRHSDAMTSISLSRYKRQAGPNGRRQRPSVSTSGAGRSCIPQPCEKRHIIKRLPGVIRAAGSQIVHLIYLEYLGLFRFEEKGESHEGMDFVMLWNGSWHEGRFYPSFPESTFVPICTKRLLSMGTSTLTA